MEGINITPADWLQFGALGLLGLFMFFDFLSRRSMLKDISKERTSREDILIKALSDNTQALTKIVSAVESLERIVLNFDKRE